jgi:tight adherence protein C
MYTMTIGLILFGLALGIALFYAISQLDERQTVRTSIRQLEDYGHGSVVETERDRELLKPARERAIAPVMNGLVSTGRRVFPTDYVARTRKKFVAIGSYDPVSVDRFLAVRIACLVIIPVGLILIFFVFDMTGLMALVAAVLVVLIALMGPEAWLNRKVDERKAEIQRSLPDILDLLVISVEAGLGFEQALDRTVAAVPGALSQEFSRMLGETRAGATRSDAMRALEARVDVAEVRSFVLAILQADTFGVSIGRVLRAQAEEMRIKRRQPRSGPRRLP